ncbi:MAG: NAD-glutamate dehydrogenase [Hyphomicrobiaceae bacterium]
MFRYRRSTKEEGAQPAAKSFKANVKETAGTVPPDNVRIGELTAELGQAAAAQVFATELYADLDASAVESFGNEALARLAHAIYKHHADRIVGEHKIAVDRVPSPRGKAFDRSAISILNDDMPFLVDSVLGELRSLGYGADFVFHPTFRVERGANGQRLSLDSGAGLHWSERQQESVIVVFVDTLTEDQAGHIAACLNRVLHDVRVAVDDWKKIVDRFEQSIAAIEMVPPPVPAELLLESVAFCRWLVGNQFTFLGLREFRLDGDQETGQLVPIDGSGLGVLRDPDLHVIAKGGKGLELTPQSRRHVFKAEPLIITKSDILSRIHRRAYMDYIGLKTYAADGRQIGEVRVVGLLTSQAYTERPSHIPFLRKKVATVLAKSGFAKGGHSSKALVNVLEHFPRDELFRISDEMLVRWSSGMLDLEMRPRVRVFARRDRFDRFVSTLVYVPRERYSSHLRERIGDVLAEAFNGRISGFEPYFPEGSLVRVHFIVGRNEHGERREINEPRLEAHITELSQNWHDQLAVAIASKGPESDRLRRKYASAFSNAYAEVFEVEYALLDVQRIERLSRDRPASIDFRGDNNTLSSALNVVVYRFDEPIPLSERVPVLENFGFRSIDERSYRVLPQFDDGARQVALHNMQLEVADGTDIDLEQVGRKLEEAYLAVSSDLADNDPFNRLVVSAQLEWREVAMLRSYAAYLRQIGVPYGMRYVAETLVHYPNLVADLVRLFNVRFDPLLPGCRDDRESEEKAIHDSIVAALVDVPSLDQDRIMRLYLNLICATQRTNFYMRNDQGAPPSTLSFKFASRDIDAAPEPRPYREIWVYSPRLEGVHLRFGPIARGGLRWSDRAQDFRTEVLDLCKAQQVKNTVIVPDGAKGGFLPKRLPRGDRGEVMAEGIASYEGFVSSLLEITDNLEEGNVAPPPSVVRRDGDDPYLVVAADKGTATFSDYANDISVSKKFWLGDAFASGGSTGYDHKKMGITARGAWESVKRHFREMNHDIQSTPFTAIGVGDMSGDVFGNGMLLSRATRLVAAFDHRDIFIDPDPDLPTAYAERKRLFDMGRSSWQDYDTTKISSGGGVFSRAAKSIVLSEQSCELLGLPDRETTPHRLLRAILAAETDLLWFGGIGTYIRAEEEGNEDVGDRTNDSIRLKACEVRAKVIGEGANLGVTQRGRIEFAQKGGRINTDFIDNSAGVNSSDKEVNIKIALESAVRDERLDRTQRNALLASMTDEVADACLINNYQQSLAISMAARRSVGEIGFLKRLMRELESRGTFTRELEFLPSDEALGSRESMGDGMTRPEISVLLSWSKIALVHDLMRSDAPDRPENERFLTAYFPEALQKQFANDICNHRLRREIVATQIANAMINRGGPAMPVRLKDATGRGAGDIAAAFIMVCEVFALSDIWADIEELDNEIDGETQLDLFARTQDVLFEQTLDVLHHEIVDDCQLLAVRYRSAVEELDGVLDDVATAAQLERKGAIQRTLEGHGVPNRLSAKLARLNLLAPAPAIARICKQTKTSVHLAARVFFEAQEFFRIGDFRVRTQALQLTDYYDRLALAAAIDALDQASRELTCAYLETEEEYGLDLETWSEKHSARLRRAKSQIEEIVGISEVTVSRLTVAAAQVRGSISR